jgi:hypothetical protein
MAFVVFAAWGPRCSFFDGASFIMGIEDIKAVVTVICIGLNVWVRRRVWTTIIRNNYWDFAVLHQVLLA